MMRINVLSRVLDKSRRSMNGELQLSLSLLKLLSWAFKDISRGFLGTVRWGQG